MLFVTVVARHIAQIPVANFGECILDAPGSINSRGGVCSLSRGQSPPTQEHLGTRAGLMNRVPKLHTLPKFNRLAFAAATRVEGVEQKHLTTADYRRSFVLSWPDMSRLVASCVAKSEDQLIQTQPQAHNFASETTQTFRDAHAACRSLCLAVLASFEIT